MAAIASRTITLTLILPNGPPTEPSGWQRLRRFLKALLRSYGIKCVDIAERKEDGSHDA